MRRAPSLAEVATDDVSARTMGESTTLTHWREVEVELADGGPRLLRAADKRLRRSGLRPAGYAAKLERALADQLPAPEGGSKLTRHSAAGDVVLAYARSQVAVLQALDPMIRRDEPDSVHDMRVATRRLRSALKSFAQILDLPDAGRLRAELKWLGGVLGEARDNEVLAPYLHARLAEVPVDLLMGPVQARVGAHFAPRSGLRPRVTAGGTGFQPVHRVAERPGSGFRWPAARGEGAPARSRGAACGR